MNLIYPLIAVLIWSFNSIIIKLSTSAIDPASISFYRWLIAFIILMPFLFKKTILNFSIILKNWWKLAILGTLGMFLYQSLAYYAASTTSAAFIGIANGIIPLMTLFLSLFFLKETPTRGLIIGGILSFLGLILIISDGNPTSIIQNGIGKGELLLFFASLSYALYGVLLKKWSLPIDRSVSLFVQIFFGLLCLIPLFLMEGHSQLNRQNLPLVIYAAIFASIIAPFVWMKGITFLGANKCAIFLNLAPLFTAIFAVFILSETLSGYFIFGGLLILIGVFIAQFFNKK